MGAQVVRAPGARWPARMAVDNATATRSLWWTIALHLLPGLAFGAFILVAVPVLANYDIDPLFALFGGIALVPVPIELGYLAVQAHRTVGSWSPLAAVAYRKRHALGAELRQAIILAGWFIALLVVSIAVLDRPIADHVFGWVPHQILQFASMEGEAPVGLELAAVIVIAFVAGDLPRVPAHRGQGPPDGECPPRCVRAHSHQQRVLGAHGRGPDVEMR